jgi:hypothetical protein
MSAQRYFDEVKMAFFLELTLEGTACHLIESATTQSNCDTHFIQSDLQIDGGEMVLQKMLGGGEIRWTPDAIALQNVGDGYDIIVGCDADTAINFMSLDGVHYECWDATRQSLDCDAAELWTPTTP